MALLPMDLVNNIKQQITELPLSELDLATNPILIDVRELQEANAGMIPGAMNIPRGVLAFQIQTHPALRGEQHPAVAHTDTPIVLYCQSGGRSALAALSLQQMGFNQVVSLQGGYQAWLASQG
jgi:rhodanese-related sulfurtransferase